MKKQIVVTLAVLALAGVGVLAEAAGVDPALQARIDSQRKTAEAWAADPVVVSAVKTQNANPAAANRAMTQDKWAALPPFDPFVLSFASNPVGQLLKARKTPVVGEAFVSAADGTKVGFTGKTTSWSHKGKAKHDVPMTGKYWQGEVELDQSTGLQSIQIAVPVLDGGRAIGSLVVGLQVARLK